ncbi:MAG TPA: YeeE/YedE thiosulfate transporter family protein [Spirochaetota bacterium]|nr:YeeE/YedE thiosulfate transporter family protein [Spirochaetota bacterium]HOM10275.1 YeeE/YedE thiosulfate transporter family protein [Spirochaetota bacterium]HPP50118.1 YeeE/YedE thiosulfate transporter family protein [Spirochaetota bacterium]
MEKKPYASPYIAGVGLGLVLLAAFFFTGHGLGASGAITRSIVAVEKVISQEHVDNNAYLAEYGGGDTNPLNNWLVFQLLGVIVGGMLSGIIAGRFRKEINHGPRITPKQRWLYAIIGGALFGFGAKFARGCTSGFILTGGAGLALGAWVGMMVMFAVAYITAYFVRKLWI